MLLFAYAKIYIVQQFALSLKPRDKATMLVDKTEFFRRMSMKKRVELAAERNAFVPNDQRGKPATGLWFSRHLTTTNSRVY